jgi:hypothetical protein
MVFQEGENYLSIFITVLWLFELGQIRDRNTDMIDGKELPVAQFQHIVLSRPATATRYHERRIRSRKSERRGTNDEGIPAQALWQEFPLLSVY